MAKPNPKATLARTLERSLAASVNKSKNVALYLTREEWAWVIEALRLAAEQEKGKGGDHEHS